MVLIPYGWHGPSMAAPGYDLYYLNVMAGPGAREWIVRDDPAHGWVRGTWAGQLVDPRLPMIDHTGRRPPAGHSARPTPADNPGRATSSDHPRRPAPEADLSGRTVS